MNWFETLTGFHERDADEVAAQFAIDGTFITAPNGRRMQAGRFETPTLAELRERTLDSPLAGPLRVSEVVAGAQELHRNLDHAGALFQVASQFNTLEMVSPTVTPEQGIGRYESDRTQGPACAVACGTGTIWRNYLVPFDSGRGQTAERQIDCLADLAAALGVRVEMRNGYALPDAATLAAATAAIGSADAAGLDSFRAQLRIGMQWDTEVTLADAGHLVSQAYCSAVPVSYSDHSAEAWEPLARLVLEGAYEATLAAAVANAASTGNPTVFLTLLGGGVFGNPTEWIVDAIERACRLHVDTALDVRIVSYGRPNPAIAALIR